ncbi:Nucleic acid-binding [Heracleum sosnowskyi]|uniref:Nucleic acid-binding n=1 Tax=Heracleum sosnowskyi TaxID=360622 RepID=A0AAD8J0E9_9APIA|nr:Nucleic acid-binding [Heracleum sosnowskyi]
MAKSMRSKRIKRLRAIRREIVAPLNEGKEAAKLAAQEAALAAPKLPVRQSKAAAAAEAAAMELIANASNNDMDVEMADGGQTSKSLKPVGGVGKKMKKKIKIGKRTGGKGNIRRKRI